MLIYKTEINDGLEDGDVLIVEMLQGVSPGMSARPKQNDEEEVNR